MSNQCCLATNKKWSTLLLPRNGSTFLSFFFLLRSLLLLEAQDASGCYPSAVQRDHSLSERLIFLTQPCSVCLPTELHQEFQGQTHGQTSLLPHSNDKPHAHGRTGLRLRLSGAPHGPHRTPGSHLRQQELARTHQGPSGGNIPLTQAGRADSFL